MASSKEYLNFILGQFAKLTEVSYRAMIFYYQNHHFFFGTGSSSYIASNKSRKNSLLSTSSTRKNVMDRMYEKLTVYFENPFWVGVFERISYGKLCILASGIIANADFVGFTRN